MMETRNCIPFSVVFIFLFLMPVVMISCESNSLSDLASDDDTTDPGSEMQLVTYENTVRNILDNACVECHNADQTSGEVRLDNFELAVMVADGGRMVTRMRSITNPMPPSGNLAENIIEQIEQWIEDGLLENEN